MTTAEVERAARADEDAQPLSPADLKRMKRTPQAKIIRRALELTQEEFSSPLALCGTGNRGGQSRTSRHRLTLRSLPVIREHVSRALNPKVS